MIKILPKTLLRVFSLFLLFTQIQKLLFRFSKNTWVVNYYFEKTKKYCDVAFGACLPFIALPPSGFIHPWFKLKSFSFFSYDKEREEKDTKKGTLKTKVSEMKEIFAIWEMLFKWSKMLFLWNFLTMKSFSFFLLFLFLLYFQLHKQPYFQPNLFQLLLLLAPHVSFNKIVIMLKKQKRKNLYLK